MLTVLAIAALAFGALSGAALTGFLIGRSFEAFALDSLREDDAGNRQSDRRGREVERVTVHAGSIGR